MTWLAINAGCFDYSLRGEKNNMFFIGRVQNTGNFVIVPELGGL